MKYFCISLFIVSSVFAQRTPLKVNNSVINNPNFTNTTSLTYSVASGRVSAILRTNLDIPFFTTAHLTNNQVTLPSINLGSGTSFPIDPLASSSYLGTASGNFTVTIATNILTDATNEINVYLYLLDSVGGRIGTFTGFTPRGYVGTNVVGTNIYWLQRVGGSWFVQQNTAYIDPALFPPSGVTAGVYGNGNYIPQVTVDDKGRVTAVTTNAVASGAGGGNVVNTGTPQIRNIPAYTDTTGTNVAPAAGITMTGVNNTNVLAITAGSVTGSGTNSLFNFNSTLNTSGNVDMWRFELTDTASGASSRFLWMGLANGTTIYGFNKTGTFFANGSVLSSGNATGAGTLTANGFIFANRGGLNSTGDGVFRFQDNVGTSFTSIQLGPTDSAPNAAQIKAASVVAGTTDTAGANTTLDGSQGTGTGAPGRWGVRSASVGTTGSAQNAFTTTAFLGGILKVDMTPNGNVGGGTDDLTTYSIPAGQLAVTGDSIEFDCAGSFAATANAKTLSGVFGSTTFITTGSLVLNNVAWRCHGRIIRTSGTAQRISGTLDISGTLLGAVTTSVAFNTTATETLSGAVTFKFTGSDDGVPADNAVVENSQTIKWMPNGN